MSYCLCYYSCPQFFPFRVSIFLLLWSVSLAGPAPEGDEKWAPWGHAHLLPVRWPCIDRQGLVCTWCFVKGVCHHEPRGTDNPERSHCLATFTKCPALGLKQWGNESPPCPPRSWEAQKRKDPRMPACLHEGVWWQMVAAALSGGSQWLKAPCHAFWGIWAPYCSGLIRRRFWSLFLWEVASCCFHRACCALLSHENSSNISRQPLHHSVFSMFPWD